MNCSRFEELVSDYLDGALAKADSVAFRSHSLECRKCRSVLDQVKTAVTVCRVEDDVETPPELEYVLSKIPHEHRALDCFDFQEIITEFLDGFVPASIYHRFEEHATACDDCSNLLTEVVYAVASCHSVHTYEEYDVPESLSLQLNALMPASRRSLLRMLADAVVTLFTDLMPRTTQGAGWSLATASMLVLTTFGFLLLGFSDDKTVGGIYRQAHVKAAELYSQGAEIYSQKSELVGRLQQVRSDIDEIWHTLGGEKSQSTTDAQSSQKNSSSNQSASSDKH